MVGLVFTILVTLLISGICSILEAVIFSTDQVEIESFKKKYARIGRWLEESKDNIEETSSAILILNTVANTFGAVVAGGMASRIFGEDKLWIFSIAMTVILLTVSEILPKNIGIAYRRRLHKIVVYPLKFILFIMYPFSKMCRWLVRILIPQRKMTSYSERDILLMTEKGVRDGMLTKIESRMIANVINMDNTKVIDIMTPQGHLTSYNQNKTIREIFSISKDIPVGRLPVYSEYPENLVGVVLRLNILKALANGETSAQLRELMEVPKIIDGESLVDVALHEFITEACQLAFVKKDDKVVGILTLDDIFEHIIGIEIAENDDVEVRKSVKNVAKRKLKFQRRRK
ncbi:MAG: CNNM domain-containing protein [Puniceicoccales bacterium]|jgi:CBS domain containing-hemolysin-like protein|nr:CNNM domain-containing protein [Puniceicoccales bacterium]